MSAQSKDGDSLVIELCLDRRSDQCSRRGGRDSRQRVGVAVRGTFRGRNRRKPRLRAHGDPAGLLVLAPRAIEADRPKTLLKCVDGQRTASHH